MRRKPRRGQLGVIDPFEWARDLRPLAERMGCAALYRHGLTILGYPPTWANTPGEFDRLKKGVSS